MGGHAARFISSQAVHRHAMTGFILAIHIREILKVDPADCSMPSNYLRRPTCLSSSLSVRRGMKRMIRPLPFWTTSS
jgi:hypothetical protein